MRFEVEEKAVIWFELRPGTCVFLAKCSAVWRVAEVYGVGLLTEWI